MHIPQEMLQCFRYIAVLFRRNDLQWCSIKNVMLNIKKKITDKLFVRIYLSEIKILIKTLRLCLFFPQGSIGIFTFSHVSSTNRSGQSVGWLVLTFVNLSGQEF